MRNTINTDDDVPIMDSLPESDSSMIETPDKDLTIRPGSLEESIHAHVIPPSSSVLSQEISES